jgi:putative nucleotidyltransferase with HDIG domain
MNHKLITRFTEHMPVPSTSLRQISRVIGDPEASAFDVAESLKLDPTLTSKVLRLANSAYIGMPRTVSNVKHAVILLGIKRIHSLLITSEILSPFKDSRSLPFSIDRFRRHSVIAAYIAESIARHIKRYTYIDEHELFSGALLHDIGKLVAAVIDESAVLEVYERAKALSIPFYRAEEDDFSHSILGNLLAEMWGFPEVLAACIKGHHCAACFPKMHRIVSITHIADVMAHLLGFALFPDEKTPAIDEAALFEIELPVERLRVIAEDILKKQDQISSLLEILEE